VTLIQNKGIYKSCLLFAYFVAAAVMLTLAQAPISFWPIAWLAYAPFVFVGSPKTRPIQLCLAAYVVGACFWLGNVYWMSYTTVAGWIAACLYIALLWPILALSIRWCRTKRIPMVIAIPILIVGAEQSQGIFLGGFYWLHLSHSQYTNTALIQIADIFGATGISFLVAMVNGAIAEIIISTKKTSNIERSTLNVQRSMFSILLVAAAVAGALVYGKWRIEQSYKFVTQGPVIGAVQTNVPQSVKESFAAEQQILDEMLDQSRGCQTSEANLIVWPETMVQGILEPQVLQLLDDSHQYKTFDKTIREHSKQGGAYVLVGAYGGSPRIEENWDIRMAEKFNAAFLYRPDGNLAPQKYYKIHLVPFGEYVPLTNVPVIHNLLLKMTPYDFDYTLNAGREYTAFEMNGEYNFSVIICYEDAVPYVVRRFVLDKEGRKRIDWLVNISNDGWFVRFKGGSVLASSELRQHTIISAFRAVENRLAILRSVNTGISCMIDTLGRIRNGFTAGNLPQNAFDRRGVAGWFADKVPIDSRITFFSRYGHWLDFTCQLCLAGTIIAQLAERFIFKKRIKAEATKKVSKYQRDEK
jgi:apolipoprotein N-acyltransferase